MEDNMPLPRQSLAWYDRLATLQEGYYYPWRSQLGAWNGEDEYLSLVRQHLRQGTDVLDVACGHGEVSLSLAPGCRSILGYDRMAAWIELARQGAQRQGLTNTTFVCYDSSSAANGGRPRIPAGDNSFDLLICRRGPFHWIEEARRVGRPGAVLLMLVPDTTPLTLWHEWLPETLRWQPSDNPDWARPAIEQRLVLGRLSLHSWWSFDVPDIFPDPEQLYTWLAWGYTPDEVPSLAEVHPVLERIFAEYGDSEGVAVRHRRYLWKAVVPS
jgi:ubiquinone/menaquinone biosynthesis C-methylase UbiE